VVVLPPRVPNDWVRHEEASGQHIGSLVTERPWASAMSCQLKAMGSKPTLNGSEA